jgi:hypothetical protein
MWNHTITLETYGLYSHRCPRVNKSFIQTLADDVYDIFVLLLYSLQMLLVSYVPYIGTSLAICHLSWFYSFTAYDSLWQYHGMDITRRLTQFEHAWAFMLGFGFLPAILSNLLPSFLAIFVLGILLPLHGMLAVQSQDPKLKYDSLPIFKIAKLVTLLLCKKCMSKKNTNIQKNSHLELLLKNDSIHF